MFFIVVVHSADMEDILERLQRGEMTLEEARTELRSRLLGSLEWNIDPGRTVRTGSPEIVLSDGKTAEQVIDIARDFLSRTGRVMISRIGQDMAERVVKEIAPPTHEHDPQARFLTMKGEGFKGPEREGKVAILTAGTSDIPVAREAEVVARELGCTVLSFYDIGVAGVHRVMEPLKRLREYDPDIVIIAAGREGALPTVISGLIDAPVIGLPVSTGYGIHPKGETALFSMLQSCSPLLVVNIDAGVVAGLMAARIARRMARSHGRL